MTTPTNNLTHRLPLDQENMLREFSAYGREHLPLVDPQSRYGKHIEADPNSLTNGLTVEEEQQLADLLGKYQGGPIGRANFERGFSMYPQCIRELILWRIVETGLEILCLPRADNDEHWAGAMHVPGTGARNADYDIPNIPVNPYEPALARLNRLEVGGNIGKPQLAGFGSRSTIRGCDDYSLFLAEVNPEAELPEGAAWINVCDIETHENFIYEQLPHIRQAVEFLLTGKIQWGPLGEYVVAGSENNSPVSIPTVFRVDDENGEMREQPVGHA